MASGRAAVPSPSLPYNFNPHFPYLSATDYSLYGLPWESLASPEQVNIRLPQQRSYTNYADNGQSNGGLSICSLCHRKYSHPRGMYACSPGGCFNYHAFNDPHLRDFWERKFSRPLSAATWRSLPSSRGSRSAVSSRGGVARSDDDVAVYKVAVRTGAQRGADTDARVYIRIKGSKGKMNKRRLCRRRKNVFHFKRGGSPSFNLKGPNLGNLESLIVEHDGLDKRHAWFLEDVVVTDTRTKKSWIFKCHQWLSLFHGDCQTSRNLRAIAYRKGRASTTDSGNSSVISPRASRGLTDYEVTTVTGDLRGAGTDANVFVTLFGSRATSFKMALKTAHQGHDPFERGNSDAFPLRCPDVGELKKVRIEHDNTGRHPGWFLDRLIVKFVGEKKSTIYYCHCQQWLSQSEGDGALSRDLIASTDPLSIRAENLYKITCVTGDKPGAGTDADVTVTLFGAAGDSGPRRLDNPANNFERSTTDVFEFKCPDLGDLQRLHVSHNNKGVGPGWFLEKIVVDDVTAGKVFLFPSHQWLARDEGDGKTARDLPVAPGDAETKGKSLLNTFTYKISVTTGDVRYAGTSARCYVELVSLATAFPTATTPKRRSSSASERRTSPRRRSSSSAGERRTSGRLWLDDGKFERGRTDHFEFRLAASLSPLDHVVVGHDNAGAGAGWYLDSLTVACLESGVEQRFPCGAWLALDEGDGLLERTLMAEEETRRRRKIPYEIEVTTGDVRGAGTDANVFIQIYGAGAKTEALPLTSRGAAFRRGAVDSFVVEDADVGGVVKIRVGHDDAGVAAGWFLERVVLRKTSEKVRKKSRSSVDYSDDFDSDEDVAATPNKKKSKKRRNSNKRSRSRDDDNDDVDDDVETYVFVARRWLAKDEGDGAIVAELAPTDEDGVVDKDALQDTEYELTLVTGDVFGAGTDANVFVVLYGAAGDTGDRELTRGDNVNKFERGQTDRFFLKAMDLGRLEKMKIWQDCSGLGDSWFLDSVEVTCKGKTVYFPCQQWLSSSEGDGQTSRVLLPMDRESTLRRSKSLSRQNSTSVRDSIALESRSRMTIFNVAVTTGDVKNAGTDANVFLTLFGSKDDTGVVALKSSVDGKTDKFERGQTDAFVVESADVGEDLERLKIWHDDSGIGSGWFLQRVVVDAPSLGKKWTFPCDRWLDKRQDDGCLERELYPSSSGPGEYTPFVPYEIVVYTSDLPGAGTDADVWVQLFGSNGSSTRKASLATSRRQRRQDFERGDENRYVLELEDVEMPVKMKIGHDDSGLGSGWHLDRVEVRRMLKTGSGSEKVVFPCGRWLAKDEDDGAIERTLYADKKVVEKVRRDGSVDAKESEVGVAGRATYEFIVATSDVANAATDADVYVQLFGQNGAESEKMSLCPDKKTRKKYFERDSVDSFRLDLADIGSRPKRLLIGHDGSGFGDGWHLAEVSVKCVKTKGKLVRDPELITFQCGRWLARNEEDGRLEVFLEAPAAPRRRPRRREDRRRPSSYDDDDDESLEDDDEEDDDVFDSRRRQASRFDRRTSNGGDGRNNGKDERRGSGKGDVVTASGRRKSSQSSNQPSPRIQAESPKTDYKLVVKTSDVMGAGTDANVFVNLFGRNGVTGTQALKSSETNLNKFERNQTDVFVLKGIRDIGELSKISIWHDNKGFGAAWHLASVGVTNLGTGAAWNFACDAWLSKSDGDKQISRELPAVAVGGGGDSGGGDRDGGGGGGGGGGAKAQKNKKTEYEVTLVTMDRKNAGCPHDAWLMLEGVAGRSKALALPNGAKNRILRPGRAETFQFASKPLGELRKCYVGLREPQDSPVNDRLEERNKWLCKEIIVEDKNQRTRYTFSCRAWISICDSIEKGKILRVSHDEEILSRREEEDDDYDY